MIHLAGLPAGTRASLPDMARAIEVPDHFLSKVLQMLCRRRLIHSRRGAGGGFELAADPETVSMLDVVETIEGALQLNVCVGEQGICSRKSWCPAHLIWSDAQAAMARVLHETSIASLARNALKTS